MAALDIAAGLTTAAHSMHGPMHRPKPGVLRDSPGLAFEERRFSQTEPHPTHGGFGFEHAVGSCKRSGPTGRKQRSESSMARRRPAADRKRQLADVGRADVADQRFEDLVAMYDGHQRGQ